MQQTKTYKLNLIEKTDTFSPDPLNDNAQKLDTALDTKFAALDAGGDALDARVTVLEAHRIVIGTYKGDGQTSQTIHLGFTPLAIFVMGQSGNPEMATKIFPCRSNTMVINDGGFAVTNNHTAMNSNGSTYAYLALL